MRGRILVLGDFEGGDSSAAHQTFSLHAIFEKHVPCLTINMSPPPLEWGTSKSTFTNSVSELARIKLVRKNFQSEQTGKVFPFRSAKLWYPGGTPQQIRNASRKTAYAKRLISF